MNGVPFRRYGWTAFVAGGAVLLSIALLGCSSNSGGSPGGAPTDAGGTSDGMPAESGTVADGATSDGGDGAVPPGLRCTTTIACVGGAVCCVRMMPGSGGVASACDYPPCASGMQLCVSSTECPTGMVCGNAPGIDPTACVAPSDASPAGAAADAGESG